MLLHIGSAHFHCFAGVAKRHDHSVRIEAIGNAVQVLIGAPWPICSEGGEGVNKDQAPNRSRQGDWNPALGVTLKARIAVPKGGTLTYPARDPLVPISSLRRSDEIDEILRSVLNAPRKEVHAAIETVLKGWPGRWRAELWGRLRKLRNARGKLPKGQAKWDEEDLEILRTLYAQGRAGASLSRQEASCAPP